jgi:hypothetical protein
LKLIYAEGEIDFIVSGPLSGLGTDTYEIDLTDLPAARKVSIQVDRFRDQIGSMSELVTKPIAAAELVGFAKSSTHPTTSNYYESHREPVAIDPIRT